MAYSIYDASIPVFQRSLKNLADILTKMETHAQEHKIDIKVLLDARLYPDMMAFTRQIQIACDHAKGAAARLAGVELPSFPDTEATVAELQARIQKTLDFIGSLSANQFEGAEDREIKLVFPWATYDFIGRNYLAFWALPNFFFHATTAYDILRHSGVKLGKADFLGAVNA